MMRIAAIIPDFSADLATLLPVQIEMERCRGSWRRGWRRGRALEEWREDPKDMSASILAIGYLAIEEISPIRQTVYFLRLFPPAVILL